MCKHNIFWQVNEISLKSLRGTTQVLTILVMEDDWGCNLDIGDFGHHWLLWSRLGHWQGWGLVVFVEYWSWWGVLLMEDDWGLVLFVELIMWGCWFWLWLKMHKGWKTPRKRKGVGSMLGAWVFEFCYHVEIHNKVKRWK